MLKKILLLLVVAIAGLAVYVAMQPDHFRIERRATVNAPPQAVFTQVNDFRKWDDWSPWAKLDPNSKIAFEGPQAGQGAVFKWSGNDKVGEGKMTLVESKPGEARPHRGRVRQAVRGLVAPANSPSGRRTAAPRWSGPPTGR